MSEIQPLRHTSLLIDTRNPRLPEFKKSQREALLEIFSGYRPKILNLAQDIVSFDLNPAELPIVIPKQRDSDCFIVLEGNRRIIALRILENPDLVSEQLTSSQKAKLHKLADQYQDEPITEVNCVVMASREDAQHWIHLRHTGENEGAGLVPWAAEERSRFLEREGEREPYRQVLDFLARRNELSLEERSNVPVTSLRRLLSTPEVRSRLGLDLRQGLLRTRLPENEVAKGLLRVLEDLISGEIHTKDIYLADDRRAYIAGLPANELPDSSLGAETLQDLDDIGSASKGDRKRRAEKHKRKKKSGGFPTQRRTLIPQGCSLTIGEPRISRISQELRKLRISDYPNGVSVLFRVFLELSLDAFLKQESRPVKQDYRLRQKLKEVADFLGQTNRLTKDQLKPVRRAAQRDQAFPAASISTFNEYVHSRALQPNTDDLLTAWEEFQPVFETIWSNGGGS